MKSYVAVYDISSDVWDFIWLVLQKNVEKK